MKNGDGLLSLTCRNTEIQPSPSISPAKYALSLVFIYSLNTSSYPHTLTRLVSWSLHSGQLIATTYALVTQTYRIQQARSPYILSQVNDGAEITIVRYALRLQILLVLSLGPHNRTHPIHYSNCRSY